MIIANITNRIPYLIPYNFSISLIFPWYWEKEIRYYVPKIITINIISLYLFLNLSNNTLWEQYKLLVDLNFITLVNELLTDIVMIHFDNLLYFSFSSSLSIKKKLLQMLSLFTKTYLYCYERYWRVNLECPKYSTESDNLLQSIKHLDWEETKTDQTMYDLQEY